MLADWGEYQRLLRHFESGEDSGDEVKDCLTIHLSFAAPKERLGTSNGGEYGGLRCAFEPFFAVSIGRFWGFVDRV